ncbi:laccase-11 [Phtheirospermum japonicum]|uniref:Laccase n=1 Tax=Phtheirospermum japonicum TaxID=374723 RepID=A0A830BG66_9LAMI|nr:laccase-11 [Phtheirospermum japonicum]
MFPGPTIYARDGDRLLINVANHAQYNMSIHWHGIKQYRNGWADGPAYVTQCPIQTGQSYTYDFNVTEQRGTLWWHAHIFWLRATVYGAIVIMPKQGTPYPFPQPDLEHNLVLGEWWNDDVEEIVKQGNKLGLPPNVSDAHTINGKPGPLFPCSEKHTYAIEVEQGKTYLLRIINAALNDELFFAIANHSMTVVEIDAVYTKPFSTDAILIAPGQTTNVLVRANQLPGRYFMAARPFMDAPVTVDNKTATAIFQYKGVPDTIIPTLPKLPSVNNTAFALNYNSKLRSLNSPNFPANVPLKVDRHLFYTIGLGIDPCRTCQNGTRLVASLNNITFVMPQIGLLEAHYYNLKKVFTTDFPDRPLTPFNYTSAPLTANLQTVVAKMPRLSKIGFNSTVELVIQDTNLLSVESHPFHLHGYNFFVVGSGIGNFDPEKDPARYNLVDPPERNTVGVPTGGWAAIRFRADNPGNLGFELSKASLNASHRTFGLVRDSTFSDPNKLQKLQSLSNAGLEIIKGSLHDEESLIEALNQVDVVICAVSAKQALDQKPLIAAIKRAGCIKRFFPSEFGLDPDKTRVSELDRNFYSRKAEIRRLVEAECIPYTYVSCNFYTSYLLPSLVQPGLEAPPRDKVSIFGDGNVKGVFVKESDVAAFTISTVDDPRTLNKVMYLRPPGNTLSMNEMVDIWEKKIGKNLERNYVSEEALLKKIHETPYPDNMQMVFIYSAFVKGDQTYFDINVSNGVEGTELYPHIKYTTISEYLDTLFLDDTEEIKYAAVRTGCGRGRVFAVFS